MTYVYRCAEHNHEVEVQQKITDAPLKECPFELPDNQECSAPCQRVIQPVGFTLKGGGCGWANNGYSGNK